MLLSVMLMSVLVGCQAPQVADTGAAPQQTATLGDGGDCELVDERAVTFGEDVGGYSANSILNTAQGTHNKTLTWANSTATGITLTLSGPTSAVYRDYEVVVAANGDTLEGTCKDYLVVDMSLRVATVDGQLNFYAPVEVRAYEPSVVGFSISLDRSDVLFNPAAWVDESFDTLTSELGAEWVGPELIGQITAYGERSSGDGEGASVSVTNIIIAQF